jgi:hypothetical protein
MVSAIFGTIIGLVGIIVGIVFLSTTGGYTKIDAKVLSDSICIPTNKNKDNDNQSCTTMISYLNQKKDIDTEGIHYYKGGTLTVWYKTNDPSVVTVDNPHNKKTLGIIFLIMGIVIPLFLWGWYLLTRKYKAAAAVGGAASAINMVSNTFN